jgi:protein YIPF6
MTMTLSKSFAHLTFVGDLWGPLLVCLLLSSTLSFTAPASSSSLVFAAVFVIVWCGAAMVTVNAQLLGGSISFFQSVCILGYCVFPMTLSAIVCLIIGFLYKQVLPPLHFSELSCNISTSY